MPAVSLLIHKKIVGLFKIYTLWFRQTILPWLRSVRLKHINLCATLVFIISLISNVISERYGEGWLWGLVLLFFSCFVRLLYGSREKPQNNRSVLLFIGNSPETHSRAQLRYSRFSNDRPRFYTATVLVSNYFFSSLNPPLSCK